MVWSITLTWLSSIALASGASWVQYRDSSGMLGPREWSHMGIVRLDQLSLLGDSLESSCLCNNYLTLKLLLEPLHDLCICNRVSLASTFCTQQAAKHNPLHLFNLISLVISLGYCWVIYILCTYYILVPIFMHSPSLIRLFISLAPVRQLIT